MTHVNNFIVLAIPYEDHQLPVVIDAKDWPTIKELDKKWKCNNKGFVYTTHVVDGKPKLVYLHEVIMHIHNNVKDRQIIHINRVGLDNRYENLTYNYNNTPDLKNGKKKARTIQLDEIDPNTLPTYIWYVKPDATHNERFMVKVGDINWKSTASSELSLRYKLEEAKMFVRFLLHKYPELKQKYSMNGDYNQNGKTLLESFYKIIHKAGFTNIKSYIPDNNTHNLLEPDYSDLTQYEISELMDFAKHIKHQY